MVESSASILHSNVKGLEDPKVGETVLHVVPDTLVVLGPSKASSGVSRFDELLIPITSYKVTTVTHIQ